MSYVANEEMIETRRTESAGKHQDFAHNLAGVARRLAEAESLRTVQERIAQEACERFFAARAVVHLASERGLFEAIYTPDGTGYENLGCVPLDESVCERIRETSSGPFFAVPLFARNAPVGLIALVFPDATPPDDVEEFGANLELFGEMAGLAAAHMLTVERHQTQTEIKVQKASTENSLQLQFSTLSHDLKHTLLSFRFGCDLLRRNIDPQQTSLLQLLSQMRNASQHMLNMTNNVLEMGKITIGLGRVECRMSGIEKCVREAVDVLAPIFSYKKLLLDIDLPAEQGVWVDELRLRQIIINLLDNASKYSPEGGVIRIFATQEESQSGTVALKVRDQGPGIPEEQREAVFCPYIRFIKGSEDVAGAGLGLAISRQFAEAMGGGMEVENQTGAGSTFVVYLRTEPPEQPSSGS